MIRNDKGKTLSLDAPSRSDQLVGVRLTLSRIKHAALSTSLLIRQMIHFACEMKRRTTENWSRLGHFIQRDPGIKLGYDNVKLFPSTQTVTSAATFLDLPFELDWERNFYIRNW